MMLYGIPYMGSKTKIAPAILKQLPDGNRFVDLFGGGFAMTHAAILSRKYRHFFYNDYNKLLVELIDEALDGKYNYARFKPEFITRERFEAEKTASGYVKYIWSFGNQGNSYMFSKEIEHAKHIAHDFVVFGIYNDELMIPAGIVRSKNIKRRREEFCAWHRRNRKRFDLQQLEQLERLQQLERLERTIACNHGSYLDYEPTDGDIVYCDPPYEGTAEYDSAFNHKEFYDWVASRPYQVWFSSYKISDKRFKLMWARQLRSTLGQGNAALNFECLYTNR